MIKQIDSFNKKTPEVHFQFLKFYDSISEFLSTEIKTFFILERTFLEYCSVGDISVWFTLLKNKTYHPENKGFVILQHIAKWRQAHEVEHRVDT